MSKKERVTGKEDEKEEEKGRGREACGGGIATAAVLSSLTVIVPFSSVG